jgi:gas vesicle protein
MRHEKDEANAGTKLTYLLIGGGIGAVLALLFAPKSGNELREDIADVTRKGLEKGKETASLVGERAGEYYEVSRERATEFYQTAQDRAGDLAGRAREVVTQKSNPFSAAIEAGKQAYSEERRRTENTSITEGRPVYPVENKGLETGNSGNGETEKS